MLNYIKLTTNQTIENLLPSLLIGHTYYVNDNTSNEYKEYVLVPKKKEYAGLVYDKDKVEDILVNKLERKYIAVDLGLPSGTKWATCNIGADKPSDSGLYFQWGETQGYTKDQIGTGEGQKKFASDWSDYKWNPSGDGKTFTKYTKPGDKLDLEDDAAHVHMGGDWHMPTPTQIQELIDNTTSTWTTQDGVNGRLFTSKNNGKSIFIPAAGDAWDGSLRDSGSGGYVWSSVLRTYSVDNGQSLSFSSGYVTWNVGYYRYYGFSVRGVIG